MKDCIRGEEMTIGEITLYRGERSRGQREDAVVERDVVVDAEEEVKGALGTQSSPSKRVT